MSNKAAAFPTEVERLEHTADYWLRVAGNVRHERDNAVADNERLRSAMDAVIRILGDDRLPIKSRISDAISILAR